MSFQIIKELYNRNKVNPTKNIDRNDTFLLEQNVQ